MLKKNNRRSGCPVSFALEIFGDKWTLLIIRDLMFKGKRTYGEFLDSEEKISTNILADRLSQLEANGIIAVRQDDEKKSRKIYSLTGKGIDLAPVILEIVRWSADNDEASAAPKEFVDRVKNDRENFINDIRKALKD